MSCDYKYMMLDHRKSILLCDYKFFLLRIRTYFMLTLCYIYDNVQLS